MSGLTHPWYWSSSLWSTHGMGLLTGPRTSSARSSRKARKLVALTLPAARGRGLGRAVAHRHRWGSALADPRRCANQPVRDGECALAAAARRDEDRRVTPG